MDIAPKQTLLTSLRLELQDSLIMGPLRELDPAEAISPGVVNYRGKPGIDFLSWDPLGCRGHRRVRRAMQQSIESVGLGLSSPRLGLGTSGLHLQVEAELARFLGWESAVLFSSRSQAFLALISCVLGERDIAIADETLFPIVSDAAQLVNCTVVPYPFGDMEKLKVELNRAKAGRRVIVFSAGVSATSGLGIDVAAISEMVTNFGAMLLLDETFALGACGLLGAGTLDGVQPRPSFLGVIADCGYGFGLGGAVISGHKSLLNLIINRSRSFTSEPAPESAVMAGLGAAISLVQEGGGPRAVCRGLVERLYRGLADQFGHILPEPVGNCVYIPYKQQREAAAMRDALSARGIFVASVPRGTLLDPGANLRVSVRAEHTMAQVEALLMGITEVTKRQ